MDSFLGLFSPMVSVPAKSRPSGFDAAFLNILKSHGEIWRNIATGTSQRGLIVCCPVSSSIGIESIPKDYLLSHILLPSKVPGEYLTLNNQTVNISGSYIICGRGFSESRRLKILSVVNLSPIEWNLKSHLPVYYINRPLLGGLDHPESADEITSTMMHKYIATMRSFPEMESVFIYIAESIKTLKTRSDTVLSTSSSSILRSEYTKLKVDIKKLWSIISERILKSSSVTSAFGGRNTNMARTQILQIIESYLLTKSNDFLPIIVRKRYGDGNDRVVHKIRQRYSCLSQSDLGIRSEFQAPQSEAIQELLGLSDAIAAADKMLRLKRCVTFIQDAVERNVAKKFPSSSSEFATDDLVLVIIWLLIQVTTYYQYSFIFTDLCYCVDFHFNSMSTSEANFNLCHFKVAVDWFFSGAGEVVEVEESDLRAAIGADIARDDDLLFDRNQREEIVIGISICSVDNARHAAVYDGITNNVGVGVDEGTQIFSVPICHATKIQSSYKEYAASLVDPNNGCSKPALVRQIASGDDYFAALSANGSVFTWGQPDCGRLGHGPTAELDMFLPVERPTKIMELGPGVRIELLSCGRSHMLAVDSSGLLYGWGDNRCGQLGLFDVDFSEKDCVLFNVVSDLKILHAASPMVVSTMAHVRVRSVACGAMHSLSVDDGGVVYSWGRATGGRLGQHIDKSNMSDHLFGRPGPVKSKFLVPSRPTIDRDGDICNSKFDYLKNDSLLKPSKMVSVFAGFDYSLAISSCGAVFSWGCGTYGKLGHGGHCDEYLPKLIKALYFEGRSNFLLSLPQHLKNVLVINKIGNSIVAASSSHHTLFLSSTGAVFGCGLNNKGQVGATCSSNQQQRELSGKIDTVSVLVPSPVCFYPKTVTPDKGNNSCADAAITVDANASSIATSLPSSSSSLVPANPSPQTPTPFRSVHCGPFYSAAVSIHGELVVWGDCPAVVSNWEGGNGEGKVAVDLSSTVIRTTAEDNVASVQLLACAKDLLLLTARQ